MPYNNKDKNTDKIIIKDGELRIAVELSAVKKVIEADRVHLLPLKNPTKAKPSKLRPSVITDKGLAIAVINIDSLLNENTVMQLKGPVTVLVLSDDERTLGLGLSKNMTGKDITVLTGDAFTIRNSTAVNDVFSRYSSGSLLQENQSIELLNWRLLYDDTRSIISDC